MARLEEYLSALESARNLGTLDEVEFEAVSEQGGQALLARLMCRRGAAVMEPLAQRGLPLVVSIYGCNVMCY